MGNLISQSEPTLNLVDLQGKVAIVTGGNSGIGYVTLQHLVRQGAKVYMASRNESKVTGAIAQLEAEGMGTKGGMVEWLKLDLDDPRNAKRAAEEFIAKEDRLDILINNAGGGAFPFSLTDDGISKVVVANYLSAYVFTKCLLPILKTTAAKPQSDVRIINVSSMAHGMIGEPVKFDSKESFNVQFSGHFMGMMKRYSLTKLQQILVLKYLQSQLTAEGVDITCISVHPGEIMSPGAAQDLPDVAWPLQMLMRAYKAIKFLPVRYGGITPAFAAASIEVAGDKEKYKGAYLIPYGKIEKASKEAENPELAKELYDTTEKIVSDLGI
ncbi:NAD-P-binding protein [Sistotremastrum niveocremeum HHB9708]|uniref:NAD-P-binding protein n=1 Tax=Sistotremastrum niveocremeum HHB9708 TaxID=1314777 RepID=A0A164NEN7_9AGAM|nr:NAD-P-binding protein [Sistotremastrum niveocremeum HHB9708]